MSILSQLLSGKITFEQAAAQTAQWFQQLAANAPPEIVQDLGAAQSTLKQGLSNAIALGDTALGPILDTATAPVEAAVTGALAAITKGASAPFSPAVDAGLSLAVQAFHTLIDELATQARAALAGPAPSSGS